MNKTMKAALEQARRQFGEPLTKPTKEERCLCGSTKWRDQVEGATWDADHSSHYILARDMAAILDRIESQSRPVAAAAEANAHRQAAPSSTRPILRELHDRLGAMIDQVGQPDYSLREMVNGLREVRDALYAASATRYIVVGEIIEIPDGFGVQPNTKFCEWDYGIKARLPSGTKVYIEGGEHHHADVTPVPNTTDRTIP